MAEMAETVVMVDILRLDRIPLMVHHLNKEEMATSEEDILTVIRDLAVVIYLQIRTVKVHQVALMVLQE
jgi:hypothetical protein